MLTRILPSNPRARAVVISLAAAAGLLVYTQLVLPGTGSGRGTPGAILFNGLVYGLLNALTAAGLVLVYRTTRVINFAQTAFGAAGGELTFQLLQLTRTPFIVAFILGVLAAGVMGLAFDLVIGRRFFRAPRLVLTVATIAAAIFLATAVKEGVSHLPFLPKDRTLEAGLGIGSIRARIPFPGFDFHVGHLGLPFGFPELFAIEMSILALVLVAALFRFTRIGVAVRAMAENTDRASLLGISVGSLSTIVWVMAGLLSGVGVILTGALTTPGAASGVAPALLLPALAAAVLARMQSLPVVVGSSVAITIATQASAWSLRKDVALINVGLMVVIMIGLLLQRRTLLRSEEGAGVTWEATEEQRPVPKELRSLGPVRAARWGLYALGLLLLIAYPFLVSTGPTVLGGNIAINAIIALSVVVLTGWAGQVSLGQYGFAAVGSVVGGALASGAGLPFWLAIPAATIVAGFVAVLVGLPALRIKGLFLGVVTLAFALAVRSALFSDRYFGWLLPDDVKRPSLLFLNFDDERSMYFLCVFCLVVAIVVMANLRRSRFGRIVIAMRENEANLQSFGVSVVRTKLLAFMVSGMLAGFAGAILAFQQRGIAADSFVAERSINVFLLTVVGGVTAIGGALLGSAVFNVQEYFLKGNLIYRAIQPFVVLGLLYIQPAGLIALINRMRDSVLRIIAQRRQIVVPSLFADYDADLLEKRLIPLADPMAQSGLSALPVDARYALASELYVGRGVRDIDRLAPAVSTKEAAAIGAAAEAMADVPVPGGPS
jgi:branched-chain amino acid transport system permease protein